MGENIPRIDDPGRGRSIERGSETISDSFGLEIGIRLLTSMVSIRLNLSSFTGYFLALAHGWEAAL
jgi:hypothetical protein